MPDTHKRKLDWKSNRAKKLAQTAQIRSKLTKDDEQCLLSLVLVVIVLTILSIDFYFVASSLLALLFKNFIKQLTRSLECRVTILGT